MPPDNGAFMVAAYVVAAVIVVGYAISLALRIGEERRRSGG
jgi:hypothetical protein